MEKTRFHLFADVFPQGEDGDIFIEAESKEEAVEKLVGHIRRKVEKNIEEL